MNAERSRDSRSHLHARLPGGPRLRLGVLPPRRVGLLGGSFNPAHSGHLHVSREALKRLGLDEVWWLVAPQNPLKSARGMAPFDARLAGAKRLARDPHIRVLDLERRLGTRYTVDTVTALRRLFPKIRFVWLMGADNLSQFSRWRDWQTIAELLPIAVIDRPSHSLRASAAAAAQRLARYRLDERGAHKLADCTPPAWVFLRGLKLPLSSTELRGRPRR